QEDTREVAHARLVETAAACEGSQVEHVLLFEGKQQLQCVQIVSERHTGLDGARIAHQLGEDRENIQLSKLEQVYRVRRRHLDQARQMGLAFPERWPRFGIQSDDAFVRDGRPRMLQFLRRTYQAHLALVAADGQIEQVLPGNRGGDICRQPNRGGWIHEPVQISAFFWKRGRTRSRRLRFGTALRHSCYDLGHQFNAGKEALPCPSPANGSSLQPWTSTRTRKPFSMRCMTRSTFRSSTRFRA